MIKKWIYFGIVYGAFKKDKMPRLIMTYLTVLFFQVSYGQTDGKFKDGNGFLSVFQDKETGEFLGMTNGVLFIKNDKGNEVILDFQGSFGTLKIEKDSNEVYDVSTKSYYGKTTSGKTEIKYETYAWANGIGIKLNECWFELTAIDGACDMVIDGIKYIYKAESTTEYLIVTIEKELELSNWQYLIRTEHTMKPDNIDDLKEKKKAIKILPNSILTFAIKREKADNAIQVIQNIFDDYIQYQESTDSQDDKNLMKSSIESLIALTDSKDLEILINVWLYYDPTDFPSRDLVYRILKESRPESINAVQYRIENKKDWETDDSAPYSELGDLRKKLENE